MVNEGVKIVCDKVLENPDTTDANSQASWESRRWMTLANYIIENDDDTFNEEEVETVKNTIREARRKCFTASVLDQVVWETNPVKEGYSYPPLPRTKKDLKREREEYERNKAEEAQRKQMEYEYRLKSEAMQQSPYKNSSRYGIANNIGGHL